MHTCAWEEGAGGRRASLREREGREEGRGEERREGGREREGREGGERKEGAGGEREGWPEPA